MKAALLVIDIQKAYAADEETKRAYCEAALYINAAAELFRKRGHVIVSIYHHDRENGPHPGDPAYEFADEVKIGVPDVVISKTHGNAFYETSLAEDLRALGTGPVLVSGFCAEHCVLDTYRGAEERGFPPLLLRGGIASRTREAVEFVERLGSLVSVGALEALLQKDGC
jgi:nicotinamidase-related amidase